MRVLSVILATLLLAWFAYSWAKWGRRRFGGVVLVLALAGGASGCSPGGPLVQFGDANGPLTAPGTVQVGRSDANAPLIMAQAGSATQPAVVATGTANVHAPIAPQATSQAAGAPSGDKSAGRDNKDINVNANFAGSGWPLVIFGGLLCAVALAYRLLAKRHTNLTSAGACVALAIQSAGPDEPRDAILDRIANYLPKGSSRRRAWERLLNDFGAQARPAPDDEKKEVGRGAGRRSPTRPAVESSGQAPTRSCIDQRRSEVKQGP